MKTYIITCDSRVDQTISLYEYFASKYWPNANITVLGYKNPTYKSNIIKFVSLGKDLGPNFLNEQLFNYFSSTKESNFIFNVDDIAPAASA